MNINATIRWSEPFGTGKYGYTCEAKVVDVIRYMKEEYQLNFTEHINYPYDSDQAALDDFIAIHWAVVDDGT